MLKTNLKKASAVVAMASSLTLGLASMSYAESVAEFYGDRTVSVISPSGVGGSIYLYALLVSNHIGKHIPGTPNVIVEDRSGGGGVKAANYVDRLAPGDGTVIGELHPSSLLAPYYEKTAAVANYDPNQFQWLGSAVARSYVGAVWHEVPVDSFDDVKDQEITFGGSGKASSSYQNPTFLAHVTGAKLRVITGYKSGGATNLAIERGEVQGRGNYYAAFAATNPDWLRDNKIKFLFKMGPDHPDLADVPPASQFMETDEQRQMLKLLEAPLNIGQAFYVDDRVPSDRAEALQKAFEDMFEDPEFIAEADKLRLDIEPRTASEVSEVIAEVADTPKEVANELDAILSQ